ncbi:nitroreductase family protein [Butyrivibrio sp. AD3002]|uniref:nitroreductase family protein n=1 Tax=Butyrivibrio sp. AD3002 TaxID=1280670 RepID=UPI0003B3E79A|nr:nitroreductase family protein [Butyrivibrio sp. AD3002]
MSRVIDAEKCIGCGKCVSDCINEYLILVDSENGAKKASFKERGRCLECGHCNAICPEDAISGGKLLDAEAEQDELLGLMAGKRTVRKYIKGKAITEDVLQRIIFAGQSAPTDRNRKSARIILVKEKLPVIYGKALDYLVEEVSKTGTINPLYSSTMRLDAKRDEILWNAEYMVVFVGSKANLTDAAIAAERMQLEAASLGVGTGYRGDMKTAINNVCELGEILGVKNNEEALICFAMGLTDVKYLRPAVKGNRKVEYI